jgi:hypothetical protein
MKKILRGVCMLAVVALAFTSCKKNNEQKEGIRFSGVTEAFVVNTFDEDRAYIGTNGNTNTFFEVNDQIMVYNLNSDDATHTNYGIYWTDKAGHRVDWYYSSGTVINHNPTETALFAFYPAEIVNNARLWEGENEAMFEIVDHQEYRKYGNQVVLPKTTLAMAAADTVAAGVDEKEFQFRNIMGGLWLRLTDTQARTITSIVYEDNTFNVTGRVHLKIDKVDPDVLLSLLNNYGQPGNAEALAAYISESGYFVDDAHAALKGKVITLDCGEGVQLSANSAKDFLITLRPLAMYDGCKITFNFAEGEPLVYNFAGGTPQQRMIRPNNFTRLVRNLSNL